MNLKNISNAELISRTERLVRSERKITHLILLHISEVEARRIYAELGYDGMYAYLTKGLGYSEGSAYRRLQSARLIKQLPQVAEKVEEGVLNLTQLSQVQKCLRESEKSTGSRPSKTQTLELLNKLENRNSWETKKTIATEMNLPIESHAVLEPQRDNSVRLEITLTAKQFEELEKAKDLLSHICPDGNWSEVISVLAKKFNQRKLQGRSKETRSINFTQPVIGKRLNTSMQVQPEASVKEIEFQRMSSGDKSNENTRNSSTLKNKNKNKITQSVIARRASDGVENINHSNETFTLKESIKIRGDLSFKKKYKPIKRKYISVHDKRQLLEKAQHCCEYRNPHSGQRCRSTYQLEIDHIEPLALGGADDISNLRVLCRTHNLHAAEQAGVSRVSI